MEEQKINKIEIIVNGKRIGFPMDMNVLPGLIQQVAQQVRPQAAQQTQPPVANVVQALGLPTPQSSHRRLEDDFFNLIRQDMNTFREFGMFNKEERTSRAIIALHNRVRRLEACCFAPEEKPVVKKPMAKKVVKAEPKKVVKKPTTKPRKK